MWKRSRFGRRCLIEAVESRLLLSGVIHVDAQGSSAVPDGASWDSAYLDLQQALAVAVAGIEIRVADGTYIPTAGADRSISFQLKSGVKLLGGYAGAGSANPDARDPSSFVTTLSGDIGAAGVASDNSTTVILASGADAGTVLDGFTITAAGNGRGILNVAGSPTISNCIFTGCTTGAIRSSMAEVKIENCIFTANVTGSTSGVLWFSDTTEASIVNCQFLDNDPVTARSGYAVVNAVSSAVSITDTVFQNNTGRQTDGGAILGQYSAIAISNCDFSANRSRSGGAIAAMGGSITLNQSRFYGNSASSAGGALYATGGARSLWTISSCEFRNNQARSGGAMQLGLSLDFNSVCSNSIFAGNKATGNGGAINSTAASFSQCIFIGNTASESGGALNFAGATNSVFIGNSASLTATDYSVNSVSNSIFWRNSDPAPGLVADYCNSDTAIRYGRDITYANPKFVRDPDPGSDQTWGTLDDELGDLRLRFDSPLVDAGSNERVLSGTTTDYAGQPRFQDLATVPDKGIGPAPVVDIGAYETQAAVYASVGSRLSVATGTDLILSGLGGSGFAGALTYEWDFDADGDFDDGAGSNATVATSDLPVGASVAISLRVTDSSGQAAIDTSVVRVVPRVLYVDGRATGANTGTTWLNAKTDLAEALKNAGYGQTLKIAAGTYKPTQGLDRRASFVLTENIQLEGGYAGATAPNPDIRNIKATPTILSGDIGQSGDASDNSLHVIIGQNLTSLTTVDGIEISGGNASLYDIFYEFNQGGGMYLRNASVRISNCIFVSNRAEQLGAAISVTGKPVIDQCQFIRNNGSALAVVDNATILNSEFYGNTGIAISGSTFLAVGCAFVGNLDGASVTSGAVVNCTFAFNRGTGVAIGSFSARIVNTISWANRIDASGLTYTANIKLCTIGNDPSFFRNPDPGIDRTWGTADDDYGDLRLRIEAPCFDVGDNSAVPAGVTTDLAGNPRFVDVPGQRDPGAIVDVGAYERVAPFADPRFDPDSAGPRVEMRFDVDLLPSSLSASDLVLKNLTTGQVVPVGSLATVAYDPATRVASWTFAAALPDGNYRATFPASSVLDTGGNPALWADLNFDFYALAGDANRDRRVDLTDLNILSSNWQGVGKTFSQGDFNYDGKVDHSDLAILSTNWQKQFSATDIAPPALARPQVRQPVRMVKLVM